MAHTLATMNDFKNLKISMISSLVIMIPKPDQSAYFFVVTNASKIGIAGALL